MDSAIVKRNPVIMSGALCIAGTRVPVKNLFDYLEGPRLCTPMRVAPACRQACVQASRRARATDTDFSAQGR